MEIKVCETEEQVQTLAELASDIWHEYFISIISKDQIDYMVEKFQSYQALKKAIQEEGYTYFLGYDEGNLVGFCGVKPDGNRLFLSKLYLHENSRGRGLSSILLKKAIEFAEDLGKKAVYLTCNKYNQNSLDIYNTKGFETIDSVKTDIGNGFIMDDYIMQLDL